MEHFNQIISQKISFQNVEGKIIIRFPFFSVTNSISGQFVFIISFPLVSIRGEMTITIEDVAVDSFPNFHRDQKRFPEEIIKKKETYTPSILFNR